ARAARDVQAELARGERRRWRGLVRAAEAREPERAAEPEGLLGEPHAARPIGVTEERGAERQDPPEVARFAFARQEDARVVVVADAWAAQAGGRGRRQPAQHR